MLIVAVLGLFANMIMMWMLKDSTTSSHGDHADGEGHDGTGSEDGGHEEGEEGHGGHGEVKVERS